MGGQNEKVLDSGSTNREINMGGKLRVHENAGEVHFHDDKKKLKVAIPSAEFHRQWNDFQSTRIATKGEVLHFVDTKRNTVAVIESISKFKGGKFVIDAVVSIMESTTSKNITKLCDFASGK